MGRSGEEGKHREEGAYGSGALVALAQLIAPPQQEGVARQCPEHSVELFVDRPAITVRTRTPQPG